MMFPPDLVVFIRMVVIAGFACWAAQIAAKALVAWI